MRAFFKIAGVWFGLGLIVVANAAAQDEAQFAQACRRDAAQHCRGVAPGEGRVVRCLVEHRADLSSACADALATLAESSVAAALKEVPDNVPAAYRTTYAVLKTQLDRVRSDIRGQGDKPLYAAELLGANANRGPALLAPENLPALGLQLDRFKQLGVGAVKIAVQFPMLRPGFPRADEYATFYRNVVSAAHARGLKVILHVAVLFADTSFSAFTNLYDGMTFDRFKSEYAAMTQRVARELKPDVLILLTEPDTHARLTGVRELENPRKYRETISAALNGMDRTGIKVAAGSGSWSGVEFARELARNSSLDYISIHLYPIGPAIVQNIAATADVAHRAGKQVIIDEAWLYKTAAVNGGTNVAATAEVFRLDNYDFWQPLDKDFMTLVDGLARQHRAEILSFFWSTLFFGSLEYAPELDAVPYTEVTRRTAVEAFAAMRDGRVSALGEHYRQLIAKP